MNSPASPGQTEMQAGKPTPGLVTSKTGWLFIEALASLTTLAGIYCGSTTAAGASLYLLSLVFWYALTVGKRLWGLMPLNIATTALSAINLWHAI